MITLRDEALAGEAPLCGIHHHNRSAHPAGSLRASFRGQGATVAVFRALCGYRLRIRELHRLQVQTLADNASMISAATTVGFVTQGTLRRAAWVEGAFADLVVLGRLAADRVPDPHCADGAPPSEPGDVAAE